MICITFPKNERNREEICGFRLSTERMKMKMIKTVRPSQSVCVCLRQTLDHNPINDVTE